MYPLCPTKKAKHRPSLYITPLTGVPTGGMGVPTPNFQNDGPRDFAKTAMKLVPGGKANRVYFDVYKKGVIPFSESLDGVVSKNFPGGLRPKTPKLFQFCVRP